MANHKYAPRALMTVLLVTIVGLTFGWFAGSSGSSWRGIPIFFLCSVLAFAVNWAAFIPSAFAQSEKFYDLVGAVTYLTMIFYACILSAPLNLAGMIAAAMVAVWCLRLGSFLFLRIRQAGTDSRFDHIKVNPARFLVAWTLQALWAIFTAAAALAIITLNSDTLIGPVFWIGVLIWLGGFLIEIIADRQKGAFRNDPANKGKFITSGLWAWSQHPNYFGEIMLWTGIVVMAIPALSGWSWLVLISPIFVTLLLTKVSGIPMLDKAAQERWGDDPAYQSYVKNTPVLVPRPPAA